MGAGLGRAEAMPLITIQLEQSSPTAGNITPTAEPMVSQSALPSTAFDQSVVATLEKMSQTFDELSAKVYRDAKWGFAISFNPLYANHSVCAHSAKR